MCRVNCTFQIYQSVIPSGRYQVNVQSGQLRLNAKQVVYYAKNPSKSDKSKTISGKLLVISQN